MTYNVYIIYNPKRHNSSFFVNFSGLFLAVNRFRIIQSIDFSEATSQCSKMKLVIPRQIEA